DDDADGRRADELEGRRSLVAAPEITPAVVQKDVHGIVPGNSHVWPSVAVQVAESGGHRGRARELLLVEQEGDVRGAAALVQAMTAGRVDRDHVGEPVEIEVRGDHACRQRTTELVDAEKARGSRRGV